LPSLRACTEGRGWVFNGQRAASSWSTMCSWDWAMVIVPQLLVNGQHAELDVDLAAPGLQWPSRRKWERNKQTSAAQYCTAPPVTRVTADGVLADPLKMHSRFCKGCWQGWFLHISVGQTSCAGAAKHGGEAHQTREDTRNMQQAAAGCGRLHVDSRGPGWT
jgi:hypothetical protein